jgi:hypothetical protein
MSQVPVREGVCGFCLGPQSLPRIITPYASGAQNWAQRLNLVADARGVRNAMPLYGCGPLALSLTVREEKDLSSCEHSLEAEDRRESVRPYWS